MSIELLIRAGAIRAMDNQGALFRAVAIEDDRIAAVSADPHGLDDLGTSGTQVIDDPGLTVLPAFLDNHNHLSEASRNSLFVAVGQARSLAELVDLVRRRATHTPPGDWIQTSNDWTQEQLAEQRLPTAADLDGASLEHPVVSRRGGHMAILNSTALRIADITRETPDPPGGRIGRLPDGTPNGILEGGTQYALLHVPAPALDELVGSIRDWCERFAAVGLGGIRDAVVSAEGMRVYQAAMERNALPIRVRSMLLVSPTGSVANRIEQIDRLEEWRTFGDDRLRTWGLKFVFDGGPENGALDDPYLNDPTYRGQLNWDPVELEQVVNAAVERGWRVGIHAIGDRTVRTLLDVYQHVLSAHPTCPPGTLVIEHGFLANREQRARAVRLGVWVTVQPALLYALGGSFMKLWGAERTAQIMPVREWLDEGAQLSAGTDYPIGAYSPLRTLWGLVTRQTESIGVQGEEYAVDRATAAWLATAGTARLLGEGDRMGSIQPGYLADLVGFTSDPLTCPVDELPELQPAFAMIGGRTVGSSAYPIAARSHQ